MSEYLEKYGKYLLIVGVSTLIILVLIVVYMLYSGSPNDDTNEVPIDPNQLDYSFLQEQEYSQEEQYLMLTSKILVEEYGTYSKQNFVGLLNVQNQSTESFKSTVTTRVNSIDSETNIETEVDPSSINLNWINDSSVEIIMTSTSTDLTTKEKISGQTKVVLIKQGEYWLVNNISSQ